MFFLLATMASAMQITHEAISNIGADTVIVQGRNTLFINAHLKDYKVSEDDNGAFTKQFNQILSIVNSNKSMTVIVMMDANTQFEIQGNSILVFSKDNESSRKRFILDSSVNVSSIISPFPTSNKMRGAHTAQLKKSFDPVTATIDHVLVFNGGNVSDTNAYVIDETDILRKVTNTNTMTTSPNCIADHAFVISTMDNGDSYGTLNIKGGNVEDKAWAEFVPQMYREFFDHPDVMSRVNQILGYTFIKYSFKEIKHKDFLSKPRCKVYDINVPTDYVPNIVISGENLIINSGTETYILTKSADNMYVKPVPVNPRIEEWIDILITDLNLSKNDFECRTFLINKGYLLLNYWHNIQNDKMELVGGRSLSSIYSEWQSLSTRKVSIASMIKMAKRMHPMLKVVSLQEMPVDSVSAQIIIDDIKGNTPSNIYMYDTGVGSTRGAIVVFDN
jgi:hypothetical protein